MTSSSNDPRVPVQGAGGANTVKERLLVFIVVFLGLLIVAGIVAVVMRIIYLSSTPSTQRGDGEATEARAGAIERLSLPPGAAIKSVSVSGDRLAIHYDGPSGSGVAVVDVASGAVLRRFDIAPAASQP